MDFGRVFAQSKKMCFGRCWGCFCEDDQQKAVIYFRRRQSSSCQGSSTLVCTRESDLSSLPTSFLQPAAVCTVYQWTGIALDYTKRQCETQYWWRISISANFFFATSCSLPVCLAPHQGSRIKDLSFENNFLVSRDASSVFEGSHVGLKHFSISIEDWVPQLDNLCCGWCWTFCISPLLV